jgi:Ca2+-binding RTX toxin-like protein
MRKTGIMVAMVALLVAMFATAAYAATIEGGRGNDTLFESPGNDRIFGRAGNDTIDASRFSADTDKLFGGRGSDTLNADDGDAFDLLDGGRGFDTCIGDPGDTFVSCNEIIIP